MQLFMNITPYTVISIEILLFGSDNLTDENNLIVFRILYSQCYHTFVLNPPPPISVYQTDIFMFTFIIYVTCCHFHIYVHNIIVWSVVLS
jgi:hypothetical protein